jgi:hypothetical protein
VPDVAVDESVGVGGLSGVVEVPPVAPVEPPLAAVPPALPVVFEVVVELPLPLTAPGAVVPEIAAPLAADPAALPVSVVVEPVPPVVVLVAPATLVVPVVVALLDPVVLAVRFVAREFVVVVPEEPSIALIFAASAALNDELRSASRCMSVAFSSATVGMRCRWLIALAALLICTVSPADAPAALAEALEAL